MSSELRWFFLKKAESLSQNLLGQFLQRIIQYELVGQYLAPYKAN